MLCYRYHCCWSRRHRRRQRRHCLSSAIIFVTMHILPATRSHSMLYGFLWWRVACDSQFHIRNIAECMQYTQPLPCHTTKCFCFVYTDAYDDEHPKRTTREHIGCFIRSHSLIFTLVTHLFVFTIRPYTHGMRQYASTLVFETHINAASELPPNSNWGLFVSSVFQVRRISWIRTFISDCRDLHVGAHTNPDQQTE